MRISTVTALIAASALFTPSSEAADCLPFLTQSSDLARQGKLGVNMVTLNKNGVASWTGLSGPLGAGGGAGADIPLKLSLFPAQGAQAAMLVTVEGIDIAPPKQLFSDRVAGPQPFNIAQADNVMIEIPVASAPEVTVTLRSHNNGKARFTGSCEPDGFLLGSTPDVKYIFHLRQIVP